MLARTTLSILEPETFQENSIAECFKSLIKVANELIRGWWRYEKPENLIVCTWKTAGLNLRCSCCVEEERAASADALTEIGSCMS